MHAQPITCTAVIIAIELLCAVELPVFCLISNKYV